MKYGLTCPHDIAAKFYEVEENIEARVRMEGRTGRENGVTRTIEKERGGWGEADDSIAHGARPQTCRFFFTPSYKFSSDGLDKYCTPILELRTAYTIGMYLDKYLDKHRIVVSAPAPDPATARTALKALLLFFTCTGNFCMSAKGSVASRAVNSLTFLSKFIMRE